MMIRGRYRIVNPDKPLGKGGQGITYLARDTHQPGQPYCVIKQFKPSNKHLSDDTKRKLKEKFTEEAKTLQIFSQYQHSQIPRLLAYYPTEMEMLNDDDDQFYIVQEYVEGDVLEKELPKRPNRLSEPEVIKLLTEILEVLEFVHDKQIIHRDLKTTNILRRKSDKKIVLIDFGAVKNLQTDSDQPSLIRVLTPGYAPPEAKQKAPPEAKQKAQPQPSIDIYAVGIIAIQALNGYTENDITCRFTTVDLDWGQMKITYGFRDILKKMVCDDPKKRYQTAQEALKALKKLGGWKKKVINMAYWGLAGTWATAVLFLAGHYIFDYIVQQFQVQDNLIQCYAKDGISINCPDTWDIQESNSLVTERVKFLSPNTDTNQGYREDVRIIVDEGFTGTLDELYNQSREYILNTYENAEIVEPESGETTVANRSGLKLVFTSQNGNQILKHMQLISLQSDRVYTLHYTADASDYDKLLETIDKMKESLTINS